MSMRRPYACIVYTKIRFFVTDVVDVDDDDAVLPPSPSAMTSGIAATRDRSSCIICTLKTRKRMRAVGFARRTASIVPQA